MKICLITETFPPEINGVAMTLSRIMDGMNRRGHVITVIAPARKDRTADLFPYPVIGVPGLPIPRYSGLRFGLPAARRLRRLWRTNRPDIIHVATEGPLGWSAVRAARSEGIPLVSSFHTNFHQYGAHYGYGWLQRLVLKWLHSVHNRALVTFAPSAGVIGELNEAGFRNLRLMGRGVDTELFGPHRRDPALRSSWAASRETPVALYAGRIAPEKNIPLSIRAFREMQKQRPDMRMVVVGDGPSRAALATKHPDIYFVGMRHGEDLARHYASADCFLFASITETFGNVVTEAMASGLAVLAFDYAAPATFIRSGINGRTVPFDDTEAFLAAARDMAHAPAVWTAQGRVAIETVKPLSWNAIVDSYTQSLESCLKRATPTPASTLICHETQKAGS